MQHNVFLSNAAHAINRGFPSTRTLHIANTFQLFTCYHVFNAAVGGG
jgi:hypothetical protein